MTITIYGIKACSTVKKARDWLDAHNIVYDFHDYKLAGADPSRLRAWCEELGWEVQGCSILYTASLMQQVPKI